MDYKIKYMLKLLLILGLFQLHYCDDAAANKTDVNTNDSDELIDAESIFNGTDQPVELSSRSIGTNSADCYTPSGSLGDCILIRECAVLWQVVRKQSAFQATATELVNLRRSQCSNNGPIRVCCPKTQNKNIANTRRGKPGNLLPSTDLCAPLGDRILGGRETSLGEFPWMVLIKYSIGGGRTELHCGGSLINDRYVVTAAHCVSPKKLRQGWSVIGVRLGEHDLNTNPDCSVDTNNVLSCADSFVEVQMEKFVVHESYLPENDAQHNDIALIRLATPVQYTRYIRPICLPARDYNLTGFGLEVAGWGKTENGHTSTIKLKTEIRGVSGFNCNRIYNSRQNLRIRDTQQCAGGEKGVDSCNDDSGGPLIGLETSVVPNYFYLAGLVSFGPTPCGLAGWPGVYTKTAPFVNWIKQNMEA